MARYSEKRLWEAHYAYGEAKFGKRRWERANFGWYSEDRSISSKVYALLRKGQTIQILTTTWDKGKGQPYHEICNYHI